MLLVIIFLNIFATLHAREEEDELSPRIMYGKKADIKDYPWYATYSLTDKFLTCGAAIISDRWLVSTGHCPMNLYMFNITSVEVGTDTQGRGERYLIDLEVRHPDFMDHVMSKDIALNDISLLRVNRSITFSDRVQPVKLPQDDYEVNVLHKVAAMGRDEHNSKGILKEISLRTYNISDFIVIFNVTEVAPYKETISRACINTKRDDGKPPLYHGDSGSALVRDNTLVGLVSFGDTSTCETSLRGIFTNVFPFVDWIKNVMGINV